MRHVISKGGLAVDMENLKTVLEWEEPTNIWDLQGILGLTGYYRKFISHYAQIARPLTKQLKKVCFGWSDEATKTSHDLGSCSCYARIP